MGMINNIFYVKVISVSYTSAVNIGTNLNWSPNSNSKSIGGSNSVGDFTRTVEFDYNLTQDPDINDQNRVGT